MGTGRCLRAVTDAVLTPDSVAVITIGPIGNTAAQAIEELAHVSPQPSALSHQISPIAHYDLRFLKPLDEALLHEVGQKFRNIVTIEDGVRNGGMGSAVLEWMNDHGYQPRLRRLGLPDNFVEHGTVAQLHAIVGIDKEHIKQAIIDMSNSEIVR